ncbi:putative Subtilisin-like serine protease 3 [Abeliophyllum distichum]|uniref:Subtilisin-like serine protease 3 n=1 Tax=Abeliophyllum distichum TaxID=126358 RepID=A0ABD1TKE4_9LAMI
MASMQPSIINIGTSGGVRHFKLGGPLWSGPEEGESPHTTITESIFIGLSHIAGIDALVKQKHPHWSPAAIESALMTTSTTLDRAERPPQVQQYFEFETMSLVRATPFDFGSSHINPRAALDSRLIFDHSPEVVRGVGGCPGGGGGGGGCRRSWRRLSPEVEDVCGGGKLVERKYG